MNEDVQQIVSDILGVCQPDKIILYAEKRTMATGKLKALSLCVIITGGAGINCRALRTKLHLAISVDVPINLNVYTAVEWRELLKDPSSYAFWIDRKGQVVYEQAA